MVSVEPEHILPAEWAPQAGVLLTWPHADSDWRPHLAAVEPVFVRIAAEVARREDVVIGCRDAALAGHVRGLLAAAGVDPARVRLHVVASQDTWARDHGPLTVIRRGAPLLLDFTFNGWGGKFAAEQDDQISRRLHALGAFGAEAMASVDLVLEGGSVECDGAGTLLTTRRCLLAGTRSGLSEAELTRQLMLFGRGDEGTAVVLAAERRCELEEGAVGADVGLVQHEVMDGNAAGDGQTLVLGAADDIERQGR